MGKRLGTMVSLILLALATTVQAAETPPPPQSTQVAKLDKSTPVKDATLLEKREQFRAFAVSKVEQLNRNHRLSRSRMQVLRQPDGSVLGKYHQIDPESLAVQVRHSNSLKVPYVGILSYRELVLEARALSAEKLAESHFSVVQIIPNKHLFSYLRGKWQ